MSWLFRGGVVTTAVFLACCTPRPVATTQEAEPTGDPPRSGDRVADGLFDLYRRDAAGVRDALPACARACPLLAELVESKRSLCRWSRLHPCESARRILVQTVDRAKEAGCPCTSVKLTELDLVEQPL